MNTNNPSGGKLDRGKSRAHGQAPHPDFELQIYYQRSVWAAALSELDPRWRVRPLAGNDPAETSGLAIVVVDQPAKLNKNWLAAIRDHRARLLCAITTDGQAAPGTSAMPVFAIVQPTAPAAVLRSQIHAAFENLKLSRRQRQIEEQVHRAQDEIDSLNEIGIALSSQRDRASLLNLILLKSREITQSDAGSIYLVEDNGTGGHRLRFTLTQNDSVPVPFAEAHLPIDNASIAGFTALTGAEVALDDVYQIPANLPFSFNAEFDKESGYRCKSMLAVPMKTPQGQVIGVVQLINSKRDVSKRVDPGTVDAVVAPFSEQCRPLLRSLASQAAVAIENTRLYESIENLFEGFVRASVTAIESRDPSTSGHSFRVADLTTGLAQAVDRSHAQPFRDVHFSPAEMKEIRYASLLHDFGKVGVREQVLVKAKKLYPGQLDLIEQRFAYARKVLEHAQSERKLAYLLDKGRDDYLRVQPGYQRELEAQLRELDETFAFILRCNEPALLRDQNAGLLSKMAARSLTDADGRQLLLLSAQEAHLLSISKGSLDEAERLEIQSHVGHTQNFLRQIPWTQEIKNIPEIAAAHHEKLDGTGYPRHLAAQDIPLQSKMMTIADIFDALSASDRPYKSAVSWERALEILYDEAKRGLIDGALLEIFHGAEIFRLDAYSKPFSPTKITAEN